MATEPTIHVPGRKPSRYNPTLRERIDDIIYEQIGGNMDSLKPETRFIEDLGADSLHLTELAIALEDEFEIEINDARIDKFVFVEDVYKYIEKAVQPK